MYGWVPLQYIWNYDNIVNRLYSKIKVIPCGSVVKNLPASAGDARDLGWILGLGRSPGEGNGNLFQYSCPENSMDRGAWWAVVCGVTKELDTTEQLSTHTCKHTHSDHLLRNQFEMPHAGWEPFSFKLSFTVYGVFLLTVRYVSTDSMIKQLRNMCHQGTISS